MRFFIFILFVFFCHLSFSQKVKYKDVVDFYQKGDTLSGHHLLSEFMKNDNEKDLTHPQLMMGIMYKDEICKLNIFQEVEKIKIKTDSAIYYYRNFREILTEKELSKNRDLYAVFEKRDMRTGKVMVKLFDAQFKIDNDIKWLERRRESVLSLNEEVKGLEESYNSIQSNYNEVVTGHRSLEEVYMQSGLSTLAKLQNIQIEQEGLEKSAEAFVSKVLDIPCSEWGVSVNFVQLEGFTRQIAQKPNFFDHEINLFDYASWASKVRETILNDVFTVKSDLLKYHTELMQLYERSSDGAIVPEVEFDKIEKILNKEMLTKYDPNPLPITLFELVKSQIRFTNEHIKELNLKDSVDWIVNLDLLKLQSEKLAISGSILNKIRRADIDRQLRYYSGFFDEAFGGLKGLETFLKVEIDKVGEVENYLIAKTAEVEKKLKFVTFNELEIPINPEEGNIQFTPFKPSENFISGIYRGIDEKKIYLARFNSSRISNVFITIPMESLLNAQSVEMVYREDQNTNSVYMVISQTAPAVQGIKTEFESSEVVKVVVDKYPCIGAKIDLATGQIIWQSEINLQGIPLSLQFSTQGNVIINYTTSEDENEFIEMNELGLLSENDGG